MLLFLALFPKRFIFSFGPILFSIIIIIVVVIIIMGEKGEAPQQQDYDSSSPKDPLDDSFETRPHGGGGGHHHHHHLHRRHHPHHDSSLIVASPFISTPLYLPTATGTTTPFEAVNPKRTRFTAGQWKLLPSPSSSQLPIPVVGSDSSPSPSHRPTGTATVAAAASSSDTTSSPSYSPLPSTASGQPETAGSKGEGESQNQAQYRKGKYVSPVWKPNEMLWLARAWRIQYQGGGSDDVGIVGGQGGRGSGSGSGKTRADKDREVAEYLQKHGVNRDAKTGGTKWDNMLGEFRKVYEWERGGEREQLVGKSYFRLSPYERKLHRLPASFDEQVFEELCQFMGSKMRTKPTPLLPLTRALPPPPPFSSRSKQVFGVGYASVDASGSPTHSCSSKEIRRIGKVRMVWEESVSLWSEEASEQHRGGGGGRIKIEGCSFLNAEDLTFFDESMVACTMESYDHGPLKGLSIDRFVSGQQIKVFGRRKPPTTCATTAGSHHGPPERLPLMHSTEPSARSNTSWEYQDPTEYYVGCLRVPPTSLPSLSELSWHIQDPPSEELRLPIRKDVYACLPQGKELMFTTTTQMLDCKSFIYEILCPIIRTNPCITTTTRDSFIGLWDDCINRLVCEFCCMEMRIIRKPNYPSTTTTNGLQDQWPNLTGFIRNFCLWRGEETDQIKDGQPHDLDPSNSIVEKLLWTYLDIPYLLGYYAVGYLVTFCALSRGHDNRIIRTDLYSLDLSMPSERVKALVPCYRIAGVLSLLADGCHKLPIFSDFERIDIGKGIVMEMTPNLVTKIFSCRTKWTAVKEIYDFLDGRIPHSEFICGSSDKDLAIVFKPRVCKLRPTSYEQLIEALKNVTKALVALHDLCFMHRNVCWENVMKRTSEEEEETTTGTGEWILCGFEEAVGAPQIYPYAEASASGRHAPEMERGLHGVKVDMWGVGFLIKTCGLIGIPKMLKELQNRCMDQNPEHRLTAADCYHHLLQLHSSLSTATGTPGGGLM